VSDRKRVVTAFMLTAGLGAFALGKRRHDDESDENEAVTIPIHET